MGHREDLLAGAKQCLLERGFGRTTARDIVAASGTNLGSIGYHFGSKHALLIEAMVEALGDWGDELDRVFSADADADPDAEPLERFAATWSRVIESFATHRQLWLASVEAFMEAQHVPELRAQLADAMDTGRLGLAELLGGIAQEAPEARPLGSLHLALLDGLMIQWLLDPERAPTGEELAEGLRLVVASVLPPR